VAIRISKFGKKFPAIVIPATHRRGYGTIVFGFGDREVPARL
jgi:hypothetical protein